MTDQPSPEAPKHTPRNRLRLFAIVAVLIGAAIGSAGIYGIGALKRNAAGDAACRPALALAKRLAPLHRGEMAALALASQPLRLPNLEFRGPDGQAQKLSDFRGRTILLNLWATWCVPCRKEMPALDALQGELGGPGFEVVAVNIDTRDPARPRAWLNEAGIGRLAYYHDSQAKIFQDLKVIGKAFGMPTTLLVDPQGCEIATLAGPAEWASEDAKKLIRAALAPAPQAGLTR